MPTAAVIHGRLTRNAVRVAQFTEIFHRLRRNVSIHYNQIRLDDLPLQPANLYTAGPLNKSGPFTALKLKKFTFKMSQIKLQDKAPDE